MCCTQYVSKFGKISNSHRIGKGEFFSLQCQRRALSKNVQCYHTLEDVSHAREFMLKILQPRFQQYVNWKIPDIQAGFWRGRESRDQIANIWWIIEKEWNSRKTSTFSPFTMLKPLTVWIPTNCGKFLEMRVPDHLTCLLRNLYQCQKATWTLTGNEQWTGSN